MAAKLKIKKRVKFPARKGAGRKSPYARWVADELKPVLPEILDKEGYAIAVPTTFLKTADGADRDPLKFSRSFTVTLRKLLGEEITNEMHVQCRIDTDGEVVIVAQSYGEGDEDADEDSEEESDEDEESEDEE